MTFYEVIFTNKKRTGIATGSDQLIIAKNFIENLPLEIDHSQECSGCQDGEKGTLYHSYLLDKSQYEALIGNLSIRWRGAGKAKPDWNPGVSVYLSEI